VLEGRTLPSTFVVTNTVDSGPGSLRAAILGANARADHDTIDFNIASGIQRIHLQSPLPVITYPVLLDGASQPRFAGSPLIVLDGTLAGPSADGLTIAGGNSTVRGLVIHGFSGSGMVLSGPGGDVISGNYIGTDVTGTVAFANRERGIYINGSSNNTIGGAGSGSGNVISANKWTGILIDGGSSDAIQGNAIGTDISGERPLGNLGCGIRIRNGTNNVIGGTTFHARNVISANSNSGVFIGVGSVGSVLQGNAIGTDLKGVNPLGNQQRGVEISSASASWIGGTTPGAGNIISANYWSGIVLTAGTFGSIIQHNFIGADATGTHGLANGAMGIRLCACHHNTIGGTAPNAGNVVSANELTGVYIGDRSTSNQVLGNNIGTDASGAFVLANGGRGIQIAGASDNQIGGTVAGSGNTISGNAMSGVLIEQGSTQNQIQGNFIGTDSTGQKALGNLGSGVRITDSSNNLVGGTTVGSANVISRNAQDGVRLDGDTSGNIIEGNWSTLRSGVALPEVWFSPAMNLPVGPLLQNPETWTSVRDQVNVLLLEQPELVNYQEDVVNSWAKLDAAHLVQRLAEWNVKLAFDASVIIPQWVTGPDHALRDARAAISNITAAGGQVSYLAMDEPYYLGSVNCAMATGMIFDRVAAFMRNVAALDPSIRVGVDEPYPSLDVKTIESEVDGLIGRGTPPAFFHLDINFGYLASHLEAAVQLGGDLSALKEYFAAKNISFGVIFWSGGPAASNQQYAMRTLQNIGLINDTIGVPDNVVFQSWTTIGGQAKAFPNGPESQAFTHTWLVNQGLRKLFGQPATPA
jgi:hypothetical protein